MRRVSKVTSGAGSALLLLCVAATQGQPAPASLTLDEFFRSVAVRSARLAPGGKAAVIGTSRADWNRKRFRDDLWLWEQGVSELIPLAQSGHDSDPAWSPDGRYIAFLSDRPLDLGAEKESGESKEITRVWIIPLRSGEPFPLYTEPLKAHSFAWTEDSQALLFSAPEPLDKKGKEAEQKQWKDVGRWRDAERGDLLLSIPLESAKPKSAPLPLEVEAEADPPPMPKAARVLTRSRYAVGEIAPSPDGEQAAFLTNSISGRLEHPEAYEIYLVPLHAQKETAARQLTHNEALERELQWSHDSKRLYFGVFAGSGGLEGKYRDVQGRLYALELAAGEVKRLGSKFYGSWTDYTLTKDNRLLALGQLGVETQIYEIKGEQADKRAGQPGSYEGLSGTRDCASFLVMHSAVNVPSELYLLSGDGPSAEQITHLNSLFTQRALPEMKPYRWKTFDGKTVEGVLLYPPGRFEAKHLRLLTLIHGGPEDADGNKWGADWYDWAGLAAARGWLVFRPNYRGSTGYGDPFMLEISPHLVSVPGKDILSGVDALVRDGIADPRHLAIGGYSYGGYMTNWLITQTTRFRSAVTGAGALEHAANWGNDDLTFDDAWYLGGTPWQNPALYQSEAALFQFDRVQTPVHVVVGADDVRVSASEGYLLERALDARGLPHHFLIFPGEGHQLGKDPWHGYIKVREELDWLEKYDADGR